MKTLILNIILVVWILIPSAGHAIKNDDILGEWITEDRSCRVEIFKKDHQYFGKIVAIKQPYYLPGEVKGMDGKPRSDSNIQDKSLRSRPLVGIELMKNFRFDDDKWIGGKIYDPNSGKTYKCVISLADDGTLQVRGYVGVSLLGRTTVWESTMVYLERELTFLGLTNCTFIDEKKPTKKPQRQNDMEKKNESKQSINR
jgi:uncharacterized protein (DUF2147 family)